MTTLTTTLTVQLQLTEDGAGLEIPAYAQPGDAGVDLRTTHAITLAPGERAIAKTGIRIALPRGYAAFIHPRSGLAAKHGLTVVNSPGTIDSDYRGELMAILLNTDKTSTLEFQRGDRIAQLVIQRVETAVFEVVDVLDETPRGTGGFGSTGGFSA